MKEGQTQKGSSQSAKSLILSSAITFWLEPGSSSPSVSYPRCRWSSHGPSSASLSLSLSLTPSRCTSTTKSLLGTPPIPPPHPFSTPLTKNTLTSESCIKGHRTSSCNHTERQLFEIKRKGRPVSQCEKCRDLRKTRRVHSKCLCSEVRAEDRNRQDLASGSGSGAKRKLSARPK